MSISGQQQANGVLFYILGFATPRIQWTSNVEKSNYDKSGSQITINWLGLA